METKKLKDMRKKIKQFFCKHEFEETFRYYPDLYYIVKCKKCEKTKYLDL